MKKIGQLKILVIGLGSMGKRRIRNLLHLRIPKEQIIGFDLSKERRREAGKAYGVKVVDSFTAANFEYCPDVYIISTPPDHHLPYALYAAKHKKHFFMEVGTSDFGYNKLLPLLDGTFVAAPSCTFRYHPAVVKMKKIIAAGEIGNILLFTYHLGQYLPDWHPWEDYRKVYFSRKETGGCREMLPYELKWLNYVVGGEVAAAGGLTRKISALDMSADDAYIGFLEYSNKVVGTIAIDLLSRKPKRTLRLVGTLGLIDWDWHKNTITVFSAKSKRQHSIKMKKGKTLKDYVVAEEMYQAEIKDFLSAIEFHKQFSYSFAEDKKVLQVLKAFERSSIRGRKIRL